MSSEQCHKPVDEHHKVAAIHTHHNEHSSGKIISGITKHHDHGIDKTHGSHTKSTNTTCVTTKNNASHGKGTGTTHSNGGGIISKVRGHLRSKTKTSKKNKAGKEHDGSSSSSDSNSSESESDNEGHGKKKLSC